MFLLELLSPGLKLLLLTSGTVITSSGVVIHSSGIVISSSGIVILQLWHCYAQSWNCYPLELLSPALELLSPALELLSSGIIPSQELQGRNSCLEKAKAGPTHLHLGIPQLIPVNLALLWAEGTELGKVWIPHIFTVLGLSLPSVKREQHPKEFLGLEVSLRALPTPRCPQTPGGAQWGQRPQGSPRSHIWQGAQMCIPGGHFGTRIPSVPWEGRTWSRESAFPSS